MLYRIRSRQELGSLGLELPQSVQEELLRCTAFPEEGLTLIAESTIDICEVQKLVDFESHPAEWVDYLDDGFLSALFVMNNSFTITLIFPTNIAPKILLAESED